jgi:hypothetical protein
MLRPQTSIETREGGAVPLAGERRPAMAGDSKGRGLAPLCDRQDGSESGMPPS